jgi:hypothetical protein
MLYLGVGFYLLHSSFSEIFKSKDLCQPEPGNSLTFLSVIYFIWSSFSFHSLQLDRTLGLLDGFFVSIFVATSISPWFLFYFLRDCFISVSSNPFKWIKKISNHIFWYRVLLCNPGWSWMLYSPTLPSQVLGLQVCTNPAWPTPWATPPAFFFFFGDGLFSR